MNRVIQGLLAAALVVLIGGCAMDRSSASSQTAPQPQFAAAQPTLAPPPAPTAVTDEAAAVQQVIQRGNEAQVEAIAARDPVAMADTATRQHFQQLVRVNANLLDNGVKSITLLNLEWGPVAVESGRATATTWETWRTVYEDGTTEQSRDRNEYALVREASGWKVDANAHPQDTASPPSAQPTPAVPPLTIDGRNASRNWSGYAASNGKYTAVGATWTIPEFSPDRPVGMDAAWVGIGGVRSRDLIQAGTSQSISSTGATQYQAWVETLPEPAEPISLAVHPGDTITVTITEESDDTWLLKLVNETTGQRFERSEVYDSSYSSAEWIQEAPSSGRGRLLPLANFGSVSFTDAWAVKDGQRVTIAQARARPITMITADNQALAIPTELGSDGSSFSVARTDVPANTAGRQRRSPSSQAAD